MYVYRCQIDGEKTGYHRTLASAFGQVHEFELDKKRWYLKYGLKCTCIKSHGTLMGNVNAAWSIKFEAVGYKWNIWIERHFMQGIYDIGEL